MKFKISLIVNLIKNLQMFNDFLSFNIYKISVKHLEFVKIQINFYLKYKFLCLWFGLGFGLGFGIELSENYLC